MKAYSAPAPSMANPFLPILFFLFFGSGCAALIYQVVWLQLLQLVIGSSAVSLGVLLGMFMGGMCLGSFILPRLIDARHHPLSVYAILELGIGVMGLALLFGMPLINGIYTAIGGSVMFRAVVAGVCLLPPTMMMGATLPAIGRWVETTPAGVSWLGFFYGGNIGGAVLGSLLAGFYFLRVYDMATATYVAVLLNTAVAVVAILIAGRTTRELPTESADQAAGTAEHAAAGSRAVYLAIALSGLTALACEVLWTRLLSLVFGATVYAFSLILGVFLFGLGIGSSVGATLARGGTRPRVALGWCQMLLCAAMGWAAFMLNASVPFWPVNPAIASDPWFGFQLDIVRCLWVALPGAILWGASFPLALAAVVTPGQDPGKLVGGVYAANTVGAIVGSLGASMVVTKFVGTQHGQALLILVSAFSGLVMLAPLVKDAGSGRPRWSVLALLVVATGAAVAVARSVPAVPGDLVAFGRHAATNKGIADILYVGEGLNAFVAVSHTADGALNYHNAGKIQASSLPQDMRLQRMLGHFTHLLAVSPRNVLVIGCGAGVTAGAVSIAPGVEHMTIAEIEPLVPWSVSTYFGEHNYHVIDNPKVTTRIDDGRHFLLTTDEKFDAITSDPLDPWAKGAATLHTREFYEVVKRHLNPGGVVTMWVPLYETTMEAVKSEIATFMEAFPNTVVWGNTNRNGQGYDLVLTGKVDVDELQAKLDSPEYAEVARSLREIGITSAVDLLSTYAGSAADLAPWLADAALNQDLDLRLQYLAGMGLNTNRNVEIYAEMLRHVTFPNGLFTGSRASLQALGEGVRTVRERVLGAPPAVAPPADPLLLRELAGQWRMEAKERDALVPNILLVLRPDGSLDFFRDGGGGTNFSLRFWGTWAVTSPESGRLEIAFSFVGVRPERFCYPLPGGCEKHDVPFREEWTFTRTGSDTMETPGAVWHRHPL
jgi:spermidine synthase